MAFPSGPPSNPNSELLERLARLERPFTRGEGGAALNKPEVLSKTQAARICFILEAKALAGAPQAIAGQIILGGKTVARYNTKAVEGGTGANVITMGSFDLNAGETWELHHEGGELAGATLTYVLL